LGRKEVTRVTAVLCEQQAEAAKLDATIAAKLKGVLSAEWAIA
jgi:hypothetical protein